MSQHQYAFGRLESRRDMVRSVIAPRGVKGLLGALGGAVLLVVFAAIAFALVDRSPPAPKPVEKMANAAERPAPRSMGASSRPKTDFRQSHATTPPRSRQVEPPSEARVEPRAAQAAPPSAPALASVSSSPAPVPMADPARAPAEVARAAEPPRAIAPAPPVQPPEEITAAVTERPDTPSEYKPSENAVWPVAPRQTAKRSAETKSEAPTDCLPAPLRSVLRDLEARFGPVTVVATTHLTTDNHSPGSIRDKLHQACKAVDIRAARDPKEVIAFLKSRPEVGGINTYRNRLVHFDLSAGYKPAQREEAEAAEPGRPKRR